MHQLWNLSSILSECAGDEYQKISTSYTYKTLTSVIRLFFDCSLFVGKEQTSLIFLDTYLSL